VPLHGALRFARLGLIWPFYREIHFVLPLRVCGYTPGMAKKLLLPMRERILPDPWCRWVAAEVRIGYQALERGHIRKSRTILLLPWAWK